MKKLILVTIIVFVSIIIFIFAISKYGSYSKEKSWNTTPGKMEFDIINKEIAGYHGNDALGNSSKMKEISKYFSEQLAQIREAAFTKSSSDTISFSQGHFITYCHEQNGHLLLICHVPQLRKFTENAKETLMQISWKLAQESTIKNYPEFKGELHVGLRGVALYYQFWKGDSIGPAKVKYNNEIGKMDTYKIFVNSTNNQTPKMQ